MIMIHSPKRLLFFYRIGYTLAQLFDREGMPLDISIGEVLLIGSTCLLLLMGGFAWL